MIIYSFIAVLFVSLISLIGVFTLSLKPEKLKKIITFLVGFAVGGLLGDAFIHLIPEAVEEIGNNTLFSLWVLLGVILFFCLEKFIRWRHCHSSNCEKHAHPAAAITLIGDGVHNFFDGMIITASFGMSIPLGISTTLAVILHEIPQEMGNFGVLLHSGYSIKKALLYNFYSAITAFGGIIASLLIGSLVEGYSANWLAMTAGGFIYIAGSDLLPELHHEQDIKNSLFQLLSILLGIGTMFLLLLME